MATIVLAFFIMLLIVAAMAIGVILSNKPIKGSCGGLSALGMKESCMVCGGDESQWKKAVGILGRADLAYDPIHSMRHQVGLIDLKSTQHSLRAAGESKRQKQGKNAN